MLLIYMLSYRLWNMNNYELLSKTTLDQKVRSCGFDNDGGQLAIGMMDGSFIILKSRYVLDFVCTGRLVMFYLSS